MRSGDDLLFDEETHSYTLGRRRLPSVTQVIASVVPRLFDPGEWYLERGRALHAAIHLLAEGRLDWSSVDYRIEPRMQALLKFQRECAVTIRESELRLCSRRLGFAGTLDAVGEADKTICLIDWKSSIEPQVDLQLGAYSLLLAESEAHAYRISAAVAVELRDSGQYSCRWLDRHQLHRAAQTFKAALTMHGWLTANHKTKGNPNG